MTGLRTRPQWVCFGIAALAVLGGLFPDGTYPFWSFTLLRPTYSVDFGVAKLRQRYAPVMRTVPPSGVVGVLSDIAIPKHPQWRDAMLARYVVAPRALVEVTEQQRPEWAFGLFKDSPDAAQLGAAKGYRIAEMYDTGLVLYRRIVR